MRLAQTTRRGSSGPIWAVAIVAIVLALASFGYAYIATTSGANSAEVNSLSTSVSSLGAAASAGVKPTTVAYKVDWCNTDNTGQDRFCPNQIVVNQGDIVQIMFIHNDTDAHTFTLDTGPYSFQINDTAAGMHDFLTNGFISGSCTNGTYAQESTGISGTYCVSGKSLLQPGGNFQAPQNSQPAVSPANAISVPMDNTGHVVSFNATSGQSEIWGLGSFQATTPGIYMFFCDYHVSNGMFGYLVVLPNSYCGANPTSCGLS
jgi:plastocyanin